MHINDAISVVIRQSSFISNDAIYGNGDDIYVEGSSTISLINTYLNNSNNNRFMVLTEQHGKDVQIICARKNHLLAHAMQLIVVMQN